MNSGNRTYHEEFEQLISKIREELSQLKKDNKALREENESLKKQIEQQDFSTGESGDLFADLTESERLAMRQHIKELISRIDNHLNNHQ